MMFVKYVLIVCLALLNPVSQASELFADFQKLNIVSGDKSSGNGVKIMKFLPHSTVKPLNLFMGI